MESYSHDSDLPSQVSCPPPDPNPKKPKYRVPFGSIDSHCHLFGPTDKFPYLPDRPYTPPEAVLSSYQKLADQLGFHRAVFVNTACYGPRHEILLDALRRGHGKYRGVALIHPDAKKEEIARLDEAGVCGARFNFLPHLGSNFSPDKIERVLSLIRPFGWHVAIHVASKSLLEFADFIASVDLPIVIDHLGRIDIKDGIEGEAFQVLLRLLDTGNVWVKLSGIDRISNLLPPYPDAIALARRLVWYAPEHVLWGTDWPHPNKNGAMPNDGELVDLIPEFASSQRQRQLLLIENPERLFRFNCMK